MCYLVSVSKNGQIMEERMFEWSYSAFAHVKRRRKQGYTVTIKEVDMSIKIKED